MDVFKVAVFHSNNVSRRSRSEGQICGSNTHDVCSIYTGHTLCQSFVVSCKLASCSASAHRRSNEGVGDQLPSFTLSNQSDWQSTD
jgi:hypothetical protein